ncbi:hypothetical protein GCM10010515_54910 [Streptomyces fructofermentans]|uniref:Uncharacterized protein n=1 Tax=Streptomyces fructofermentans TaxID=152141 RepID=A0A918NM48_9ACTN|nr:hypothetical protein GCM10010515_54910 [Streptomyces fructofermentans]
MESPQPPTGADLDRVAESFEQQRSRLFGIAYRILGSVTEAEDVVQDAWLRWQATDRDVVREPGAFLTRMTTRLAINVAQSARVRRETYVGPWLPEPVDTGADPQLGAERGEALELAVLLLLERLNPVERAAYVLREAFRYPYDRIADVLRLSPANTRQIVSRARKHLSAERREPVDAKCHRRLLEAFITAARTGDVAALENVLSAGVVAYADGNGVRGVARTVVTGPERVARINAHFKRLFPDAEYHEVEANGLPGLVITNDGATIAFVSATVGPDGIDGLYWLFAPDKLRGYERSRRRSAARRSTRPRAAAAATRSVRRPGDQEQEGPTGTAEPGLPHGPGESPPPSGTPSPGGEGPADRPLSVAAGMLPGMDELEFMRGRVYGADHENAAPRPGHVYAELVGGPLDGLLLDVTEWPEGPPGEDVALPTDIGRHGPGGRALYTPRAGEERCFDWSCDIP